MLAHFVITKVKQFSKTHFKFDTIDKSKISVAIPTPPPPPPASGRQKRGSGGEGDSTMRGGGE